MQRTARQQYGPLNRRRAAATALLLLVTACASAPAAPGAAPGAADAVPGFDTREYPGDAVMAAWLAESPYRWVGYYLPAPCYTGTSWTGRRAPLQRMGWGLAVLFVGEQDWAAGAAATAGGAAGDTSGSGSPRCTRTNLTVERGSADAAAASAAAEAEGFPDGTIVFLDVERVETVSPELAGYVRAWTAALLDEARYVPGIYAHDRNAADLLVVVTEEYLRRQRVAQPPLWVARQAGFELAATPAESGHPASIWQGVFDRRESWGGTELRIDVNVADTADPSRGR